MAIPIIEIQDLSHRYNVQWAIKDINLTVFDTGVYGLLGANGAGKSTIMNIMCGVLKSTTGNVLISEVDMNQNPVEAKKNIGFLPQTPPLQAELTIKEYLTFCARVRLMQPGIIPDAVEKVMKKCSVSHFRNRLIRNLSGGYRQRVGLAQAIIHDPKVVILDEPTNGLDPNQILEVRSLIRELAEERTVILSTHILQEVQALCDHIWMINEGAMVFSGPLDDFDNYMAGDVVVIRFALAPPADLVSEITGVREVEVLSEGRYRIHIHSDANEVIDRIVRTSVEHDWRLLEISQPKSSLESVFAELSKKPSI